MLTDPRLLPGPFHATIGQFLDEIDRAALLKQEESYA